MEEEWGEYRLRRISLRDWHQTPVWAAGQALELLWTLSEYDRPKVEEKKEQNRNGIQKIRKKTLISSQHHERKNLGTLKWCFQKQGKITPPLSDAGSE